MFFFSRTFSCPKSDLGHQLFLNLVVATVLILELSEMVHPCQRIYSCFVEKCIVTFSNISSLEAHLKEHAALKNDRKANL